MRSFLVLFFFIVAACGPSDSTPQQLGPVQLGDLPLRTASALCDKIYDCCTTEETRALLPPGVTRDTCPQPLLANLDFSGIEASVQAGTTTYDADAAGDCVGSIVSASCELFDPGALDLDPHCAATFTGHVSPGGACAVDEACIAGAVCIEDGQGSGTCAPLASAGGECSIAECGTGLFCDATAHCAAKLTEGQACASNEDCISDNCVLVDQVGSCQARLDFCQPRDDGQASAL